MTRHLTKVVAEVREWSAIPSLVEHAQRTMLAGARGPALLTLPMDVLLELGSPATVGSSLPPSGMYLDSALLETVAQTLSSSRRGLIVAGNGVRWGD